MRLEKISYVEFEGTAQEWGVTDLELWQKNLLVGKNATGKSRSINIIWNLSLNLVGLRGPGASGRYQCHFSHDGSQVEYVCEVRNAVVISERFVVDGKILLERQENNTGIIRAEGLDVDMRFQSPPNIFSVLARRDTIQHPFLEPLFNWAAGVRYFPFGSHLGKDVLVISVPNAPEPDERDSYNATAIFKKAVKVYGQAFADAVMADMRVVNYPLVELKLDSPLTVSFETAVGSAVCLMAKEAGLPGWTDQYSMSQGMFRVLALLIQINYIAFAGSSGLILIDDIGEGLDYERSCLLVGLLRDRSSELGIQLVMSTNDRFIMNAVPLEEWSVLKRQGNRVSVRNICNSKEVFEDFRFTGLSNFSFFEMDFFNAVESDAV